MMLVKVPYNIRKPANNGICRCGEIEASKPVVVNAEFWQPIDGSGLSSYSWAINLKIIEVEDKYLVRFSVWFIPVQALVRVQVFVLVQVFVGVQALRGYVQ
jgi:hypothetical protein